MVSVDDRGEGRADVFGAKTRALLVQSERPVANLAVTFRPGAAASLLGVRANELTDRFVGVRELLGPEGVSRLLEASDLRARHAVIEATLLASLSVASSDASALAAQAARRFERGGGQIRVAELAAGLGVGERRLERALRAQVGVGPKTFARIVRFRAACRALECGGRPVEIALEQGYFDPPHLVRDFVAFAGAAPRRIFPSP